ncbi:MAG: glycoside hydrolase family 15 protein, partial [Actinomycetota bacterium]|nr:glycoside hydrolase family 15 protein [Actinomycetota bacterium]
ETQFETPAGMIMVTDALIFASRERAHQIGTDAPHALVRVVEVTKGTVAMEVEFAPRPEYGIVHPRLRLIDGGLSCLGGASALCLSSPPPTTMIDGTASWHLDLRAGERICFALHHGVTGRELPATMKAKEIAKRLADTVGAWESWSELHQSYEGPWKELVHQSGRVLKGLTYQPTGAIVAAPTTSLPEEVGGSRNWDYRYAWIRDASMTMNALWIAACPDEAHRFLHWIIGAAGTSLHQEHGLQIMYGVGGEHDLSERELPHLQGWGQSRPVRVGNGAWRQHQADIYGELLDAVYRLRDQLGTPDDMTVAFLAEVVDAAVGAWKEPDQGIWEIRGEPQHFLHSKLMCWVALDRGIKLFEGHGDVERLAAWALAREEIRAAVEQQGWSEERGAYTQAFGSTALDASALMLSITGFLAPDDPRMLATIELVADELSAPCGLIHRYRSDDGVGGGEATFALCTYWLVECLALAGQLERAGELFERITAYANDVGLLSEEVDPLGGELLGNFPQAFSHVGLVNAAWAIAVAGAARSD